MEPQGIMGYRGIYNNPNDTRILAISSKWPKNSLNFVIWPEFMFSDWHACNFSLEMMQNLGSFPKGWRGSKDLGQDPDFFRTFMGGVLESQKY